MSIGAPAVIPEAKAVPHVFAAINQVQLAIAGVGVGKDAQNAHDRYQYRSIDAVLNALSPLLAGAGLIIAPRVARHEISPRQGRNVTLYHHVAWIAYDFISIRDGSMHTVEVIGEASDRGDKGFNKALAAAYKYVVGQVFCIPYHVEAEADSESPEISEPVRLNEPGAPSNPEAEPLSPPVQLKYQAMQKAADVGTLKALMGEAWPVASPGEQITLQHYYDDLKAQLVEGAR